MPASSWALRLADAVAVQLAGRATYVAVRSIDATSDDVLEVTFSSPDDGVLRGIRIDREVIETAPSRLAGDSLEEIAFDVVTMAICEPRRIEEFCEVDGSGVRWLPLLDWLADIS